MKTFYPDVGDPVLYLTEEEYETYLAQQYPYPNSMIIVDYGTFTKVVRNQYGPITFPRSKDRPPYFVKGNIIVDAVFEEVAVDNPIKTQTFDKMKETFIEAMKDESYFIPVRVEEKDPAISAKELNDELEYIQNKLFAALKIPKSYLGYEEDEVDSTIGCYMGFVGSMVCCERCGSAQELECCKGNIPKVELKIDSCSLVENPEVDCVLVVSVCDCGAEKARTTHAGWCSKHVE